MELNRLVCLEAEYMLEHKSTVRETGKAFGRSKSTIHKDMRDKLPSINRGLAVEIANLLNFNLEDRARRGGIAAKRKRRRRKENQYGKVLCNN
jgi:putative DeoR family transcriptional regulator (stage III sporulation protein D)